MPTVFVVGSSNVDYSVMVDRFPDPGATVLGTGFSQTVGGKGANQAAAAHRAGAEVVFVTKVGADAQGEMIIQRLREAGLAPNWILRDPIHESGVALILVERTGRNQIAVAPGGNQALTAQDVRHALSHMQHGDLLLVQLEVPLATAQAALQMGKARGATTILNPAPAQALSDEVLRLVDVLIPNETEATALTDCTDVEAAARALFARGVSTVIVTLGEQGALLCERAGIHRISAYPVHAVDTTGAGDAFCGALACGLAEGWTLERSMEFANAAGALTTMKPGALDALPTREEILRLQRSRP
ncbi:MAG: ribokinase [Nitrospirae bacterium]|nr:ribokinase [Nitrospirota bacterium]